MPKVQNKPQWFRIAHLGLATVVLIGLAGNVVHALYHLKMPSPVIVGFAVMSFHGGLAFVLLEWIGVWAGYVAALDAVLYSTVLVMIVCGGVAFIRQ